MSAYDRDDPEVGHGSLASDCQDPADHAERLRDATAPVKPPRCPSSPEPPQCPQCGAGRNWPCQPTCEGLRP